LDQTIARLESRFGVTPKSAGIWAAAVVFALFLGLLAAIGGAWTAFVMLAAVLALGAFYVSMLGFQVGLVLLLVVSAMADHFTVRFGPVDIRAEELAGITALIAFAVLRYRTRDITWVRPSSTELLLGAWLAWGIVASLVDSPDRGLSAKYALLYAVCILGLLLPRRLLAGQGARQRLDTVIRWLLVIFATEATYGSIGYLLHAFGPTIAISPNPASGHLESFGTLWEPNLFGAMSAAGAVAWVYFGPTRFRHAWIGLALCMSGLVDSLTRAAWLAAGAIGVLGISLPNLRRRIDLVTGGWGLLAGLLAAGAVLVVDAIGSYTVPVPHVGHVPPPRQSGVFGALLNMTDFVGRINQVGFVWDDIHRDVIFGRGLGSFLVLHQEPPGTPEHIASLPLLVLNDTGIVGLVLFGAFAVTILVRVWRRRHDEFVAGLGQVALLLVLANLATQTSELMIGWLLIGILIAAAEFAPAAESSARITATRAA
jgi:hypothetical protein